MEACAYIFYYSLSLHWTLAEWVTSCESVVVFTRKEELAAVTVPWGLMKAGFSLPIFSMEDGRMPLSLETMSRPGEDKNDVIMPYKNKNWTYWVLHLFNIKN